MLTQLSVKNLAVIEELDLSFEGGMTVITGETGAGKSIILQALNLVLGGRGDANLIRQGEANADVGARFFVATGSKIERFLKELELAENNECILRRVISADGRSKAFLNGANMPLSTIQKAAELLLDMHGQNEHQLLLKSAEQQQLLDSFGDINQLVVALNLIVAKYQQIVGKITDLDTNNNVLQKQRELLSYQLKTLDNAALEEQELQTIEADFKVSANAQSLIEKVGFVLDNLNNDEGINAKLLHLNHELSSAKNMDKKLTEATELLTNSQLQTQEGIYELEDYLSKLSVDEEQAKEQELRIAELHNLARQHNCQIRELLTAKNALEAELNAIDIGQNSMAELCAKRDKLQVEYQQKANNISSLRGKKSQQLAASVSEIMQVLGMPGSEFSIDLAAKPEGVHLNGDEAVNFLVKTNMGQSPKLLKKIASGGELSRISLAISVVSMSHEYTPTLIFDEVDVGISGRVAEVVGQKLRQLSAHYQIICITHLAQVAALGHQHLLVSKTQTQNAAKTTVTPLSTPEKITELARIIGGIKITPKTINTAKEMLEFKCEANPKT